MPEQQAWSSVSVCLPPPTLSLPFLFDLIPLIFLIDSLVFFLPLSPFLSLSATCLSYLPSLLCPHPTSLWQICSRLSFFYSIILPLSCHLICSFHSPPLLHWARRGCRFYFPPFCSCSSFPELFRTLYSFIIFKEWKRGKKWEKVDEDGGENRGQPMKKRGRWVKEERLKAHYFPSDGRKWVRGQ